MLRSASPKAGVSNKVSLWGKIEVTRVQVFLRWVATEEDKGLPARATEKREHHHRHTGRKLTNNKHSQSFWVCWTNYCAFSLKEGQKKPHEIYYSCWKLPIEKKINYWNSIIFFTYQNISQGVSTMLLRRGVFPLLFFFFLEVNL